MLRLLLPSLTPTRQKLLGNVVWLYGLQGLNYLLPLAVLPYLVRVLGIDRYGLLASAQAFAQYFTSFTDYGFNLSATKKVALVKHNGRHVSGLFWAVISVKTSLMVAGLLILVPLLLVVPHFRVEAPVYAIAYLAVVGSVLFPVWLFQGMEQMRYISLVSGGAKVLSATLIFVLVRHPSDYLLAMGLQSGGALVAGITGLSSALLSFNISFGKVSWEDIRQVLRDGWHLFVSNAAATLYSNTYVFLVGILAGYTQAGYFSAAEKITRAIIGILGPVTQTIFPHISVLAAQSRDMALRFLRKGLVWIGVLSLLPSTLLLIFARPIAFTVLASRAEGSVSTLRWIALLPFVLAIGSILAIQTMIPFGLEKQLSRIYIFAGLGSLACAIPSILWFGSPGAGACLMGVEIVVTSLMWIVLRRHGIYLLGDRFAAVSAPAGPPLNPKTIDNTP